MTVDILWWGLLLFVILFYSYGFYRDFKEWEKRKSARRKTKIAEPILKPILPEQPKRVTTNIYDRESYGPRIEASLTNANDNWITSVSSTTLIPRGMFNGENELENLRYRINEQLPASPKRELQIVNLNSKRGIRLE